MNTTIILFRQDGYSLTFENVQEWVRVSDTTLQFKTIEYLAAPTGTPQQVRTRQHISNLPFQVVIEEIT